MIIGPDARTAFFIEVILKKESLLPKYPHSCQTKCTLLSVNGTDVSKCMPRLVLGRSSIIIDNQSLTSLILIN